METPWIRRRALRPLVWLCLLLLSTASFADIDTGAAWLRTQQLASGEFYSSGTTSTSYQATAEALETLSQANAISADAQAKALSYLQGQGYENTEFTARYALAAHAAGAYVGAFAQQLLAVRNPDGGIGDAPGYDSAIGNSAFALRAISAAGLPATTDVGFVVGYLLQEQQQSGGWADGPNHPSIYVSALASIALQRYRFQYSVGTPIAAASAFLLATQQPSGGWADATDAALALLALIPVTTDSTRYAAALQRLRDAQLSNGSWENDVFATALALRALHLAKAAPAPVDPTTGAVSGRVIDNATGASIAGVSITLEGASAQQLQTQSDGRFAVNNLPPGAYKATYSVAGYAGAAQDLKLLAGQQLDLGTVRLSLLPNTAVVAGTISFAETGGPIAGATVTANGTVAASTAADGSYTLTVAPGDLALSVAADGYAPVSASGSLAAGAKTTFSVSLYPEGSEPPVQEASLRGVVVDATSRAPLPGVEVALAGTTQTALTDGDGRFVFTAVPAGELVLEFSLAGYGALSGKLMVVQGSPVDAGTIELQPTTATTTVAGRVFDPASGDPIAGATVEAAGVTATTAADGSYRLEGITSLEFKMSASAPGFLSAGGPVLLQEPALVRADIPLVRAETGGLAVTSLSTAQPAYPAYSTVPLAVTLHNSGEFPTVVRLYVKVFDAAGVLVDEYPAVEVGPDEDPAKAQVTVASGTEVAATAEWHTGNRSPGAYQLLVQAYDAATSNLLAERATSIQVQETTLVESLLLKSEPAYTNLGATEALKFSVLMHQRSNVPFFVQISYSLQDPDSQVLHVGQQSLQVDPAQPYLLVPVGEMTNTFTRAGEYKLKIDAVAGAAPAVVEGASLYVAPGTRLEIQQEASPGVVVPDGNKRINVRIRLNGVEQQ
jgi:5-hydroxyisourate hydrolase-like protein (transthyretin family)